MHKRKNCVRAQFRESEIVYKKDLPVRQVVRIKCDMLFCGDGCDDREDQQKEHCSAVEQFQGKITGCLDLLFLQSLVIGESGGKTQGEQQ